VSLAAGSRDLRARRPFGSRKEGDMISLRSSPARFRSATLAVVATLFLAFLPGRGGAEASGSYSSTLGIPYRTVDGITLDLDAYAPDSPGPFPVLLIVHGGGWRFGSRITFDGVAARFAAAGYVAFSADYRLSPPGGTWHATAPVDDLKAAMLWIRANASAYGGDPTRVGAVGGSSGGNLVQMLATTGTPEADRPDAIVSLSGPSDLPAMVEADSITYKKVINYVGCSVKVCGNQWRIASPIDQVTAASAPTYLANSTQEQIPVDQATSMAAALKAAGVPVRLDVIDGDYHSLHLLPFVWDHILLFLHRRLG
jgi:acetyl esterase